VENTAFIGLGSNMGDRYLYLIKAIDLLDYHSTIELVNVSSVYETDPVGYEEQDLFLNMVIEVKTNLSADELLANCMKIEQLLGRKREIKWGPRTIDLDILLFNQENIETEKLNVPHPRMLERAFVMVPLLEIRPDIQVPALDQSQFLRHGQSRNTEGVRIWKRKNGEDVFVPIES
jgi:2-amino-4-hydroxy-6-hydroxymethyldihydropteridine diphosphokinase